MLLLVRAAVLLLNLQRYITQIDRFACCRAILKANCYHAHGHDAPCSFDGSYYMLMFGGVQLLLSSIPDFHDMAWLSVLAAVMSFSYAFIGLGLGLAKTICKYYALLLPRTRTVRLLS